MRDRTVTRAVVCQSPCAVIRLRVGEARFYSQEQHCCGLCQGTWLQEFFQGRGAHTVWSQAPFPPSRVVEDPEELLMVSFPSFFVC